MLCCLPLLYVWLTSRVGERVSGVSCIVKRALQHGGFDRRKDQMTSFMAAEVTPHLLLREIP